MKSTLIIISGIILFNCSEDSKQNKKSNNTIESSITKGKEMRFYRKNSELEISNLTDSSFNFTLNASYGANVGMLEGAARFKNTHTAYYSEDDCAIVFNISGDTLIQIEQSGNCDAGAGVSYSGKYSNKKVELSSNEYMLTEKGIFKTSDMEDKFKDLTKEDYKNFVSNFEQVTEEESTDNLKSTVFTGMVPGLGGINEGIILITEDRKLYAALLNDDKINYYSNDNQNPIPDAVQNWINRFEDKEVVRR